MRILICTNVYPPRFVGGAELVAHELARQMLAQGHEVAAFVGDLNGPGEHLAIWQETRDGVQVHRINTMQQDYDPQHLNFLHPAVDQHFSAVLREFRPDVVHCHNLMGLSVRLPILAAEFGARVFVTLHDFWGFCLNNTLLRPDGRTCKDYDACRVCLPAGNDTAGARMPLRLRKGLFSLAFDHVDKFIAPSPFIARQYQKAGLDDGRIAVISNGMDLQRFAPRERPDRPFPPVRLLYVGYLGTHKGVDILLQALALLADTDIDLEIIGTGSQEQTYRDKADQLGLTERIIWRGRQAPSDMPQNYARADVVVLPSIWEENQPVCLMEAMASGLPIVASRIGGIPDMINDGQEGLLCDPGDPYALSRALRVLIDDPDLRSAMGAKGRRRLQDMSYAGQASRLLRLFTDAAQAPVLRGPAQNLISLLGDYDGKMQKSDRERLDAAGAIQGYVIPHSWLTDRLIEKVDGFYLLDNGNWMVRIFRFICRVPLVVRRQCGRGWRRYLTKILISNWPKRG
ncbi:glycosyltransferase family 4 protein [Novosphingobium humi]|uniref:glycosyltransferase family 4 protein n=1 Tax=Novosphingobium humi TaxID=2282397 RepID=UPI0025B16750|nr:glycosyltransferase family 4 protein [Novosphingobium humi]WJS99107.1 glycosyltransferase family 4 protein [Novosphingobium humi]